MKTILDVLQLGTAFLEKHSIISARRQAEELIAFALQMPRLSLYMRYDQPLDEKELSLCRELLKRRSAFEPLSYILGEQEFLDCHLHVGAEALIPRQETELLAEKIVNELAAKELEGKVFWDICCGTGCIGLAIKKRLPQLHVVLSDISEEALFLAKKNGQRNGLDVEYRQGNLLEPFVGEKAHYVVCNPPYIAEEEWDSLEREVRHYEPRQALISGPLGTEVYAILAKKLPEHLYDSNKVWLEIGDRQGAAVQELFQGNSWRAGKVEQDLSGKDRFFSVESQ
jgi:release factor glutamine methyltransferase